MKHLSAGFAFLLIAGLTFGPAEKQRQPIIDVHWHSESLSALQSWGQNPVTGKKAPESVKEHIKQTLATMDRYHIVLGIASGDLESVEKMRRAAPDRVWAGPSSGIPGLEIKRLRPLYQSGRLKIMGEVCAQYDGLSPSDAVLEPYFALAESLDVPACIHMGMSFSGITESCPKFRVSIGNPLLLEELLNRHPRLRVWIAHMGYPFLEETIGILNVYPQAYVDTSAIDWVTSQAEFSAYLKQLVRAGFGKKIMFGSDQMTWPDAIGLAVKAIDKADFLSANQKRDILYNNAARFLRLSPEQVAGHNQR